MKRIFTILSLVLTINTFLIAQNALNFDGNNDIVQTTYAGVLGTTNRTFEAWVFVSPNAPTTNLAILDYGTNAVGSRNTFSVTGTRGITFISGGTNANIGSSTPNLVTVGQWTHVAFVLNNGIGYLYVNGSQVASGNLSTVNTPANNQTVRIGQRVSGGSIPFEGSIDEVRIWNVARTASEIQSNMNAEFCGSEPNLQLYLKFNNGTANGANAGVTTAIDDSGNGNNGTLSNFSLTGNTSNWVTGAALTVPSGNNTFATMTATSCNSYTLPSGNTVTTSGNYLDTIPNTQCGDSIITVNLTINNNTSSNTDLTVCGSYDAPNGDTYYTSQTINYTISNAAGCDSLVTLNLTVLNPSSSIVETSCGDYISPSGSVLTTSQIFTDTITSYNGCDSVITIDLTIIDIDSTTTSDGNSLTANETNTNATFQWYECFNDSLVLLSGETSQSFVNLDFNSHYYAVEVSVGSCSVISDCVFVVSTDDKRFASTISIFPNPTNGNFTIDLGEVYQDISVEVYSLDGKMIYREEFNHQQSINTHFTGAKGIYTVKILTEKGIVNKMMIKE